MDFNLYPDVINALTLVITDADLCKQHGEAALPDMVHLRGTIRDVALVDRVVHVAKDGVRTYIKDRYPEKHLQSGAQVVEHEVTRPQYLQYEEWTGWCDKLVHMRMKLHLEGKL